MTPYELSVRRAKNWKESALKIWKTQLTILILTIVAVAIILIAGLITSVTDSAVILALGVGITAFIYLVAYIFQWIFTNRVRDLAYDAPNEDKKDIELLATSLVLNLVATLVNGMGSFLSEFDQSIGVLISFVGGVIALISCVMQIVAAVKLSNSTTLPALAKKGAKSLILYYIINIVAVIGIVVLVVFSVAVGSLNMSDIDSLFVGGFAIVLLCGVFFMIVGIAVAMFMYYRAWWLISKSELEVLPEPELYDVDETQITAQ